jgi:nicotinamide-nucleotide amidase
MPGVPSEMRYLMQNEVLSRIKGQFKLPVIVHKTIMTLGLGESYIAEEIKDIEDALPSYIKLAYLPSPGLVKLRLSGKGEDKKILEIEIEALFDRIEERIPESVYARKEVMIEEIVGDKLRDKGYTIATAESCTSGALASKIASVSGASEYFIGSIVAYSNDVKKNILDVNEEVLMSAGAVSQETVKQMALGAKKLFGTDYAIATSGIAGPTGGTDEKPVGTVWIGIAFPQGVITEKFQMGKVRERVVRKTVLVALGRILSLIK